MSYVSHAFVWSPAGKVLTSWLLLVMFIILLSNVVYRVRCLINHANIPFELLQDPEPATRQMNA